MTEGIARVIAFLAAVELLVVSNQVPVAIGNKRSTYSRAKKLTRTESTTGAQF